MELANINDFSQLSPIPDAVIRRLAVGDEVKLSTKYEHFWLRIVESCDQHFFGILQTALQQSPGGAIGIIIEFNKHNIFDVFGIELYYNLLTSIDDVAFDWAIKRLSNQSALSEDKIAGIIYRVTNAYENSRKLEPFVDKRLDRIRTI